MRRLVHLLIVLSALLTGCAKIEHMDELLALQSFSDNQDAQKRYLAQEEQKFQNLLSDVKQQKLSPGISKLSIFSTYGKPILITEVKDDLVIKQELMYRHPAQLLGSEKVFLYFDAQSRLVKWQYLP
jgi:hypothetical protein